MTSSREVIQGHTFRTLRTSWVTLIRSVQMIEVRIFQRRFETRETVLWIDLAVHVDIRLARK